MSAVAICACGALSIVGVIAQQAAPQAQSESVLSEATRLYDEANRQLDSRQYKEANQKLERALSLRRQGLGENHPDVARAMKSLANAAYGLGNYARAEELLQGALKIAEPALGADDLFVAETLSDLAAIFQVRGDYVKPEPMYERALAIYERASVSGARPDEVQESIASTLGNLGELYSRRRDFARAEANYQKALRIREQLHGASDPSVASMLANLGGLYYTSAQYQKAIDTLQRVVAMEKVLPPNHPALVRSFNNLAAVYSDRGDYLNAERLLQRALTLDEQTLDPRHPRIATRLLAVAETLRMQGEYERAEPLYARAQSIREQSLGPSHPQVAETLIAHSLLRYTSGDMPGAVAMMSRGAELRESTLQLVMTTGSQDAKRLYVTRLLEETDIAVSLHLAGAPSLAPAATLALNNIIQRKGRPLDAMTDQFAALRRRLNTDDQQLLARLSTVQGQLAGLVLSGVSTTAQQERVGQLRDEIQQLEQTISTRSAEFRTVSHVAATLGEVQRALPAGSVLIEFASYRPFFVKKSRDETFGPPRYAAYVLGKTGIIASADLGEASEIDRRIQRFRTGLSSPSNRDVHAAAQAVYQSVVHPIESSINGVEHVFISPDGALNLIPFAALMGADGKYLIERYTISYVTSGRDFIRFQENANDRQRAGGPPMIVADPSFDGLQISAARIPSQPASNGTRAIDAAVLEQGLKFKPLPGTAQEAAALQKVLPDARVYTGVAATEALLKQTRAPSILHIATHGFFLRPAATVSGAETRGLTADVAQASAVAIDRSDALVLSGLALAGANQRSSGDGQDGILTALEATGLDLWGTRMVVLSACETGVGDVRNGEGVYGLRRALVLAGSESQVMSLWQVSDAATTDLMVAYYKRLRAGEGRAEALRNVQREFVRGGSMRSHPFYWASFIQSGDWRPAFN